MPSTEIAAKIVMELRKLTGAKIGSCRKALELSNGDMDQAVDWLKRHAEADTSKGQRATGEGAIVSYIHNNTIGVMVEIQCETDFVARNGEFQELLHNVCLQVAAGNPKWVDRVAIPHETMDEQRRLLAEQTRRLEKSPEIENEIVDGRMEKFFRDSCLMDQTFIKDEGLTIGALVKQLSSKVGENVRVVRFVRWELGE